MLKRFILVCMLGCISFTGLSAQSDTVTLAYTMINAGLGPCRFHAWKNDSQPLHFTSSDEAEAYFAELRCADTSLVPPQVDFTKNDVLLVKYNGTDCKASFKFNLVSTHADKTVTFFITVIDGGCRAAGNFYEDWVIIPKIDKSYRVKLQYGRIDMQGKYTVTQ